NPSRSSEPTTAAEPRRRRASGLRPSPITLLRRISLVGTPFDAVKSVVLFLPLAAARLTTQSRERNDAHHILRCCANVEIVVWNIKRNGAALPKRVTDRAVVNDVGKCNFRLAYRRAGIAL